MVFLLGSREVAGEGLDVYSPQSPLGRSIDGKKVGEDATFELPNGKKAGVRILDVKPHSG
jgi:transcription elongation factor GreA